MAFQQDPTSITWRAHFSSAPEEVYDALDSDVGRASFWAESATERNGTIHFRFINGLTYDAVVVVRQRPQEWAIDYFGSDVRFVMEPDGSGGTDLTMTNTGVADGDREEVTAGWLNVLLPMKAWIDFGVDLRSHDSRRTWDVGYVDQ